jgi:hypothetical protein
MFRMGMVALPPPADIVYGQVVQRAAPGPLRFGSSLYEPAATEAAMTGQDEFRIIDVTLRFTWQGDVWQLDFPRLHAGGDDPCEIFFDADAFHAARTAAGGDPATCVAPDDLLAKGGNRLPRHVRLGRLGRATPEELSRRPISTFLGCHDCMCIWWCLAGSPAGSAQAAAG